MNDIEFFSKFDKILEYLLTTIEEQYYQTEIECDLDQDVLTFKTKAGVFVINKQSSIHEIWLSSPVSGPHHFSYKGEKWIARNNIELFDILSKELLINFVSP